jgi:SAM-dependent methyltransferase
MANSPKSETPSYRSIYDEFDSPVMSRLRNEAYGEDIGQHSWVTADDLRRDVIRLNLGGGNKILDLGCGPCGPLTYIMKATGCSGYGLDLSEAALAAGRRRAASLEVADRLEVHQADLDAELEIAPLVFDAAVSFDVVLHLRDRVRVFREIARALVPGGRFLFTDAAVVNGCISSEDVAVRSIHGFVQFCASGFNENAIEHAGFKLLETEDRTQSLLRNARGRLQARLRYQAEFQRVEGEAGFAAYQAYLQAIIALSEGAALSRVMYLAETRPD